MTESIHEMYMKKALELAKRGAGQVSPNPMVGAVIVRDSQIIAKGWHTACGKPHAEVEALRNLVQNGYKAQAGDTMYVTLEPCNHFGKTPPCTEAIIDAGIGNVVVAVLDPNPQVSGSGVERLRQAGVTVTTGICETQAAQLNRFFMKSISRRRPYCSVKWAMSLDGKMATDTGDSKWISSEASRRQVHEWRGEYDAVLVGSGTVLRDDPLLNVRMAPGRNPHRIVVDSNAQTPVNAKILTEDMTGDTIIAVCERADEHKVRDLEAAGARVLRLPEKNGKVDLAALFDKLFELGITSIFAECGPVLQGALLEEQLIDRVYAFVAGKIIGGSVNAPFSSLKRSFVKDAELFDITSVEMLGGDVLITAETGGEICSQG